MLKLLIGILGFVAITAQAATQQQTDTATKLCAEAARGMWMMSKYKPTDMKISNPKTTRQSDRDYKGFEAYEISMDIEVVMPKESDVQYKDSIMKEQCGVLIKEDDIRIISESPMWSPKKK